MDNGPPCTHQPVHTQAPPVSYVPPAGGETKARQVPRKPPLLGTSAGRRKTHIRLWSRFRRAKATPEEFIERLAADPRHKPTTRHNYVVTFAALWSAAFPGSLLRRRPSFKKAVRELRRQIASHIVRHAPPLTKTNFRAVMGDTRSPPTVRAAVALAFLLGLRFSDVLRAEALDIHGFTAQGRPSTTPTAKTLRIRIRGAKNLQEGRRGHWKWLPCSGAGRLARDVLARLAAKFPTGSLFREVSRYAFLRALRRHQRDATLHSPRRGAATALADEGVSMNKVRVFLGHVSADTTRLYVEPRPAQRESQTALSAARLLL